MYKMLKYGLGIFLITLIFMTLGAVTAFASEEIPDDVSSGSAIETTTCEEFPAEESTEVTTESPEVTTESPIGGGGTTERPAESTTENPAESTTESPTESTTESPTESTTENPTESTTENLSESTTWTDTESTTEKPTKPENTTESTTEGTTQETTKKDPVYHYGGGNASSKGSGNLNSSLCRVTFQSGERGSINGYKTVTFVITKGTTPKQVPKVTARLGSVFTGWSKNGITLTDPVKVKLYANTIYTAMYEDRAANLSVLSGLISFDKLFDVIDG